jgi:hypothetical protein
MSLCREILITDWTAPNWSDCTRLIGLHQTDRTAPNWSDCTRLIGLHQTDRAAPDWSDCTKLIGLHQTDRTAPNWSDYTKLNVDTQVQCEPRLPSFAQISPEMWTMLLVDGRMASLLVPVQAMKAYRGAGGIDPLILNLFGYVCW